VTCAETSPGIPARLQFAPLQIQPRKSLPRCIPPPPHTVSHSRRESFQLCWHYTRVSRGEGAGASSFSMRSSGGSGCSAGRADGVTTAGGCGVAGMGSRTDVADR
jgi:hypothetical protein